MNFQLTLNINPDDLNVINAAQQKIALAKPAQNQGIDVIWLAFDAFESNTVQWEEDYWLYASNTATSDNGAVISKLSEVQPGPAVDGSIYSFTNNATFDAPVPSTSVASGTFSADNNMSYDKYKYLTFGLSQSAMVNQRLEDRKPLSATSVLATQNIQITPYTYVYIWLESHFETSTIITDVTGNKATAKFGGGVTDITMSYDGKSGVFRQ